MKNKLNKYNARIKSDGIVLLKSLLNQTIKICFFDPQYRGILDALKYGNEGKSRGKERSSLMQMSEPLIKEFILLISNALLPSGYLFLWIDKFHLCEGITDWLKGTQLKTVDLITWNKDRMGMGYRSRRTSEYLVVIQKKPTLAKTTWSIKNIRDVWTEKITEKRHTHQKPYLLQKELILATTSEQDIVLDPAAGSFLILDICQELNRQFIGCDIK